MKPLIQKISRFKNGDCIRLPQILWLFDRLSTDQQELNLTAIETLQKRALLCNLGCQMACLCRIDDDFTEEILSILLDSFGYPIPPAQAKTLDLAFSFAAAENPKLESEIRQLNAGLFKVKSGGKQKQLDLF